MVMVVVMVRVMVMVRVRVRVTVTVRVRVRVTVRVTQHHEVTSRFTRWKVDHEHRITGCIFPRLHRQEASRGHEKAIQSGRSRASDSTHTRPIKDRLISTDFCSKIEAERFDYVRF